MLNPQQRNKAKRVFSSGDLFMGATREGGFCILYKGYFDKRSLLIHFF